MQLHSLVSSKEAPLAELLRLALDTELIGVGPLQALLERTQETERILLGMLKHRRKFKA